MATGLLNLCVVASLLLEIERLAGDARVTRLQGRGNRDLVLRLGGRVGGLERDGRGVHLRLGRCGRGYGCGDEPGSEQGSDRDDKCGGWLHTGDSVAACRAVTPLSGRTGCAFDHPQTLRWAATRLDAEFPVFAGLDAFDGDGCNQPVSDILRTSCGLPKIIYPSGEGTQATGTQLHRTTTALESTGNAHRKIIRGVTQPITGRAPVEPEQHQNIQGDLPAHVRLRRVPKPPATDFTRLSPLT